MVSQHYFGNYFNLALLFKKKVMKKFLLSILFLLVANFYSEPIFAQGNKTNENIVSKKSKGKLKKDGTPDMRYAENKNAAKPVKKHLKKDGTPDKRYKENKK